eukprot:CAMPEP_0197657162 /NCGR_PEP_ID=MMETSP1338-20131121/44462_1 /TAXON_ID=43686 ORGANISM="Pelagodinium beii, Strain RCC1491" /NCGR_SAMPLE_ID=MMETSP1338 /ASSEMBLY_ACC=CAM_ASM_000754 /LENGTH=129 /DNA_ID=CAMNT_0043233471 /DNA_START=56 /DNA_END=445 /DNA_ORIENTATION=-
MAARMPGEIPGMSYGENLVFTAKFETEQLKLAQRLCWDRCSDTLRGTEALPTGLNAGDQLPDPTRRCLDMCFSKFCDTAVVVSQESEAWNAEQIRAMNQQSLATKAAIGTIATGLMVGLGAYLFRGGDD